MSPTSPKPRSAFPLSLVIYDQNDEVGCHAMDVTDATEGNGTLADEMDDIMADHGISDLDETYSKIATAEKATAKLDATTFHGYHKVSEAEWLAFTEGWPLFETLPTEWDEGDGCKDEWHYRWS